MNKYYIAFEDGIITHSTMLWFKKFEDIEEEVVKKYLVSKALGTEMSFNELYAFTSIHHYNEILLFETKLDLETVKEFIKEREFYFDLELVLKSIGKLTRIWSYGEN